jgi:site-specific DNA-methyltransferase (adenine-specific)
MSEVKLYKGDCIDVMRGFEDKCIDLTVTSPPYDNLRTYKDTCVWDFDVFKQVANELYRITKDGGVVVWVVGDATINGSETGTSFKQALYFKEIGFNLHDTMIYEKQPQGAVGNSKGYWQTFEYMFVFSKGLPNTINLIKDRKNTTTYNGYKMQGHRDNNDEKKGVRKISYGEFGRRTNIWFYNTGGTHTAKEEYTRVHPAQFPEKLALDHILSWSNEGDVVLDCFLGSGTTGKMAVKAKRNFIGIEKVDEYFAIAERRIKDEQSQQTLF